MSLPRHGRTPADRAVVIVLFDGVQSLDVTGPLEVFAGADRYRRAVRPDSPGYTVRTAAPGFGPVRTSSGLTLVADSSVAEVSGPVDTLVVAGGDGVDAAVADDALVASIAGLARRSSRVTSVCSGAFLLAAAGLLDGKRATTHWSRCDELAERHPEVTVEPDPIFTRDGNVFTSAGVTAGMDLALALVADDLGRHAALTIARHLVLFLQRSGSQAQFSAQLATQLADRDEIRDLQQWIADHPDADCSVAALARRAAMSPRHLARVFADDVGTTPARYVEAVRVEVARRRLEESTDSIETIATNCGFGTTETLRRAFARHLGLAPGEYRMRFA
ncbi:MAG TPA: DJ-1/PfpI family protein [Acidimicrobiales bacterium]|nr:DJ-1/PfpI family protein [Acidimicrobiales bacterium]